MVDRLFCYGTLRDGETARSLIAQHVADSVPATCRGRVFAFEDGWPGMLADPDRVVVGDLVTLIDLPAAFALLDAYEGGEFVRVLAKATLEGGAEVWCWTYLLTDPSQAEEGEEILSGDWSEYRALHG